MLCSGCCGRRAQVRCGQRVSDIKVTNFKETYFNSQTGPCERSGGREYGEEPWYCPSPMAHRIYHHLDGQHGGSVLDNQFLEEMESVCG